MAKKTQGKAAKLKAIVNTTPRVLNVSYRPDSSRASVESYQFRPGLNRVEKAIVDQLVKEPGFRRLFDGGRLSGSPGDIDMAKDIEAAQKKGKDSKQISPPEKNRKLFE